MDDVDAEAVHGDDRSVEDLCRTPDGEGKQQQRGKAAPLRLFMIRRI